MNTAKRRQSEAKARERFVQAVQHFIAQDDDHLSDPHADGWCPIGDGHPLYEAYREWRLSCDGKRAPEWANKPWRALLTATRQAYPDADIVVEKAIKLRSIMRGQGMELSDDGLICGDTQYPISGKSRQLLAALLNQSPLTIEQLRQQVWGGGTITKEGIKAAVYRLNHVLREANVPLEVHVSGNIVTLDRDSN